MIYTQKYPGQSEAGKLLVEFAKEVMGWRQGRNVYCNDCARALFGDLDTQTEAQPLYLGHDLEGGEVCKKCGGPVE